jgi:hypothetical protein
VTHLTDAQVARVATALAEGPLYKTSIFEVAKWFLSGPFWFLWPSTVSLFCTQDECQQIQRWETLSSKQEQHAAFSGAGAQFLKLDYLCRNCKHSSVTYFVHLWVSETRAELMKVGQWPALSRAADPVVVAGWSDADKLLYRDALTFRNSNKGIGALPYLRRIIETHLKDILTLISDADSRKPIPGFDPAKCEAVLNSHRFSDKLDFTKEFLPPDLVPAGAPNPIGALYDLISEGIHERTEDECVEIFDRCKAAFEFVVKKLTEAKREDEAYAESLRKLKAPHASEKEMADD